MPLGPERAHASEFFRQSIVKSLLIDLFVGPDLKIVVLDVDEEVHDIFRSGLERQLVHKSSEIEEVLRIVLVVLPSADEHSGARNQSLAIRTNHRLRKLVSVCSSCLRRNIFMFWSARAH